jgi:DNA mismatch repair protein MutH
MAFILYALEAAFIVLFLGFTVTQVIWPLIEGTQTFPIFRRRQLEQTLILANELQAQEELLRELEELTNTKENP